MTVQLIRSNDTGEDWFIEINPRYGGGAPLSMRAGAQSAESLLRMIAGMEPISQPINNNAVYCRFDQSVVVAQSLEHVEIKGVIFDVDDTLYLERNYVRSGYRAIARYLGDADIEDELWSFFCEGMPAIDAYVENHDCCMRKTELLEVYHQHKPEITLLPGVENMLNELREKGMRIGIITDGRPESQRNKIVALGLDKLIDMQDIIITDELGGTQFRKPCDIAFRIMQIRWQLPSEQILYVGDNASKDSYAPNKLGMTYVRFVNKRSVYYNSPDNQDLSIINSLTNLHSLVEYIERRGQSINQEFRVHLHKKKTLGRFAKSAQETDINPYKWD